MNSKKKPRVAHGGTHMEKVDRHETPEMAVCDRCGVTFPYVRELMVSEEEEDVEFLCSDCLAAVSEGAAHR